MPVLNHTPNEPLTTPHDVACQRWMFLRHLAVTAGLVACVWLMVDCSRAWIDVAYRPAVAADSAGVGK